MKLDPYFTPRSVASQLVALVQQPAPAIVVDPAAGDGALLEAGEQLWPQARMVALDCDPAAVRRLKRHVGWEAGRCDFLSDPSRTASRLLRDVNEKADVVLLNPPYSGRGQSRWHAHLGGIAASSGRAMAFLVAALSLVRDGGEIVALLPSSAVTSQRDAEAWELIQRFGVVKVAERFPRGTFAMGTAATVAVHIARSVVGTDCRDLQGPEVAQPLHVVEVVRGVVQVHQARSSGLSRSRARGRLPFVHTTDLHAGRTGQVWTVPGGAFASPDLGPCIFLPRVGKPLPDKVVIWNGGRAVLSDCVFALRTGTIDSALEIQAVLKNDFDTVARSYVGSCAPYLTIAALIEALSRLGLEATWPGPSRWSRQSPAWWTR
jgi:hypothetical protein